MARKSKQTQAEDIAKAELEATAEAAANWVEDVTDAINDLDESLGIVIETVNSHAAEGNKLHETVSDNLVRIEANRVLLRGLRADTKVLRSDVAACSHALNRINARLEGLEAFETFQRNSNDITAALRRTLADRVRRVEDAVYVKEPTLWERIKARFSSDAE